MNANKPVLYFKTNQLLKSYFEMLCTTLCEMLCTTFQHKEHAMFPVPGKEWTYNANIHFSKYVQYYRSCVMFKHPVLFLNT